MSKEIKSTPALYQGLNLSAEQNTFVVEDVHGFFYIFEDKSHCHIIREAVQKQFEGIGTFLDLNKQTILAYHEHVFKETPDKRQDLTLTAQYCWAKIITLAIDRRANKVPVSASGRKSTIGLCEYRKGSVDVANLKTPQANACLRLFLAVLTTEKATVTTDAEGKEIDRFVTEEVLKQYVIDHAAELHTKQDPWRIFQYYRPILITDKLITRK